MAFMRLDHIGVVVKDINQALELFTKKLGFEPPKKGIGEFPELKFRNAMLRVGDNYIELLESSDPKSDIGRFLEKRGEGLFHLCIEVDDLDAEVKALKDRGVDVFEAQPTPSTPYKRAFIRRKDAAGVLIELVPRGRRKAWE